MTLIPVKARSLVPSVCPDCRQVITLGEKPDGSGVVFSGDPAGYRLTKNLAGDLIDHFDAAELHGCLK
jgi:hypothetical protein